MYFYKIVRGRECYQIVRRLFWLEDSTGTHAHDTKFYGGFFISKFEGFCTLFLNYQTVRRHTTRLHAGRRGFEFRGFLPTFLLPDCTGQTPWRWLLFSPPKTDHFQYYYSLITLWHSLRLTTLASYSTSHLTAFEQFWDGKGAYYQTTRRRLRILGLRPIVWLPDCTGAITQMMAAFFPAEYRSFSILLLCTYHTLAFTAT